MGSGGQLLWPVTESWGQPGASAWERLGGALRAFKEVILVDSDLGYTH